MPPVHKEDYRRLANYGEICWLDELDGERLEKKLPSVTCVLTYAGWPSALDARRISMMNRLQFVQSAVASVSQFPFKLLGGRVIVCSNAGAFSGVVSEYAWGLLLAAAKNIIRYDSELRMGTIDRRPPWERGMEVSLLDGKVLGVIGYGGIGKAFAGIGRAFGMKVFALSRRKAKGRGVTVYYGRAGLLKMLPRCDAFLVSLPLTKDTKDLIGEAELSLMKKDAILVNVARGDIVDMTAMYNHLRANPNFKYATDVWWQKDGAESFAPDLPFLSLSNFIGTPHVSGPSAFVSWRPFRESILNLERFLNGRKPKNVVKRSDYLSGL